MAKTKKEEAKIRGRKKARKKATRRPVAFDVETAGIAPTVTGMLQRAKKRRANTTAAEERDAHKVARATIEEQGYRIAELERQIAGLLPYKAIYERAFTVKELKHALYLSGDSRLFVRIGYQSKEYELDHSEHCALVVRGGVRRG